MFQRHRRIAWLLNHRTLMPFEVGLMQRLGYEVFVPKVIPESGFRSGAVTYEFDTSLRLPPARLALLNEQNFYETEWSPRVVETLNRYFATVFVMPHGDSVRQAVEHFEGTIVLRAFGLDGNATYADLMERLHSPRTLRRIGRLGSRFVLGEGYDNIHLIEPPVLAERAAYLPIGMPAEHLTSARRWENSDPRILVSCPSIGADRYYTKLYEEFRESFGDLPYVVTGSQDRPVDDPNVLGFVDDLTQLYASCAVLYYPSREPRHVHYTPIEAAAVGQPIVYYRGSLVDTLIAARAPGGVDTPAQARALIERLLAGDAELAAELVHSQQPLLTRFSEEYCLATWRRTFDALGIGAGTSRAHRVVEELARAALRPIARGRVTRPPAAPATPDSPVSNATASTGPDTTLGDGLDLTAPLLPRFVVALDGLGPAEPGGRWIVEPDAEIVLTQPLPRAPRIAISTFTAGDLTTPHVRVQVGRQVRSLEIDPATPGVWAARVVHFDRAAAGHTTIRVRLAPGVGSRKIGLSHVRLLPALLPFDTIEPGGVLASIDFNEPELGRNVEAARGVSGPEGWGRWTHGAHVEIDLDHTLAGPITLRLRAAALGRNVGAPIDVSVGTAHRTVHLGGALPDHFIELDYDVAEPTNRISLRVPHPEGTPTDPRLLGVALAEIELIAGEPRHVG